LTPAGDSSKTTSSETTSTGSEGGQNGNRTVEGRDAPTVLKSRRFPVELRDLVESPELALLDL
jgi:hypothetical protein